MAPTCLFDDCSTTSTFKRQLSLFKVSVDQPRERGETSWGCAYCPPFVSDGLGGKTGTRCRIARTTVSRCFGADLTWNRRRVWLVFRARTAEADYWASGYQVIIVGAHPNEWVVFDKCLGFVQKFLKLIIRKQDFAHMGLEDRFNTAD